MASEKVWIRSQHTERVRPLGVIDTSPRIVTNPRRVRAEGFWFFFSLVLAIFVSMFVIVTLFELLPDIVANDASVGVVSSYFFYLLPQILYWVIPLAVLVAVLVNLGTLTKTNETLAVKAGAISLYRLAVPLVLTAMLLSVGLYAMQDFVLPYTNQRQDEFRNRIKGRPAQTYRDPLRKWMAGSENQIYYYKYFNPDQTLSQAFRYSSSIRQRLLCAAGPSHNKRIGMGSRGLSKTAGRGRSTAVDRLHMTRSNGWTIYR